MAVSCESEKIGLLSNKTSMCITSSNTPDCQPDQTTHSIQEAKQKALDDQQKKLTLREKQLAKKEKDLKKSELDLNDKIQRLASSKAYAN